MIPQKCLFEGAINMELKNPEMSEQVKNFKYVWN